MNLRAGDRVAIILHHIKAAEAVVLNPHYDRDVAEVRLILGTGPEATHRHQTATVMHRYLAWVV